MLSHDYRTWKLKFSNLNNGLFWKFLKKKYIKKQEFLKNNNLNKYQNSRYKIRFFVYQEKSKYYIYMYIKKS